MLFRSKINRKYTALIRALSDVQEIKRKEASNEQLSDAVEMLGRAEIDMFEAVFGADGTETIQQFYKDHYIEMAKEVIPFITGVVIPRLTEIKAENKKALVSQYNRAKKRRRFW